MIHGILSLIVVFGFTSVPVFAENPVVSQIKHNKRTREYQIFLGKVSMPDSLPICPLETMPPDLGLAVGTLVEHVRNSVSKIKASQSASCQSLQDRLATTQSQLSSAINNHFVASANISSNMTQDIINTKTQQANAVNLLVLTASDMIQHQCIESIDDRIVLQRLIGQVISIGGLLYGSWQGILIATGGQLITNLPLFRSELDKALKVFQKYDEVNERGSFLCLFRQMQKTSCLMFAESEDKVINGMDMSMQTGPAQTTKESIDGLKQTSPAVLEDIIWLREIETTAEPFINNMQKPEALKEGVKAFDQLRHWCLEHSPKELKNIFLHPEPVHRANEFLRVTCTELNSYRYPGSFDGVEKMLTTAQWSLLVITNYYRDLKKADTHVANVAKTWESSQYFEQLHKSVLEYQTSSGNQKRLNYFHLVRSLEESLAKESFIKMMDHNYQTLLETKWKWLPKSLRLTLWDPMLSDRVRKRALIAMIDLCQTLDPTLACLHVGSPALSPLHQEWENRCVGRESQLCHRVLERGEKWKLLENEPAYQAYYDSLCGW